MTTAALAAFSHDAEDHPHAQMSGPEAIDRSTMARVAQRWLQAFELAVNTGDRELGDLFSSDRWWRDVLAFTWTIVTFTGGERTDGGSRDALGR